MNLTPDHHEPKHSIKRNFFNKAASARLTRCLDRLAHWTITVNHIKRLTIRETLSIQGLLKQQPDSTAANK